MISAQIKSVKIIPFKKRPGRKAFFLLPVFLLLLALLFSVLSAGDGRRFQALTAQLFRRELSQNTLSMHYVLAFPEHYGIPGDEAVLPLYSKEAQLDSFRQTDALLEELKNINRFRLNDSEAKTYDLLLHFLEEEKESEAFAYYSEPFAPSSGIQSQLPVLLAEYAFRSRQDVDNYLSLLEQCPAYFESLLIYEQEKSRAGLLMADYSLEKSAGQCQDIITAESVENGTHFLHTTFLERLSTLEAKGLLSTAEKEAYTEKEQSLLLHAMVPAYENLRNGLLLLKGTGKNQEGLAHYPQGKEYYSWLLRRTTGSWRSIPDLKKLLLQQFTKDSQALSSLVEAYPQLLEQKRLAGELSADAFPLQTPEAMITHLQQAMQNDFPAFPNGTDQNQAPFHKVKKVSENMEPYSSPAFYLTPPIDDVQENSIYINYAQNPQGLTLYTTLAHEGYPGHLYQTVYDQLYQQKAGINPARNLMYYGGYVEGWALYVEMLSYQYAIDLATAGGADETTAAAYQLKALDRSLQLCLYTLLDIAIHHDGADYETIHTLLSQFGIDAPETTRNIYEYIVEEPATYPKYYVGYLEILNLKAKAKAAWGSAYTDKNFHQYFLECGPGPFAMIPIG